MDASLFLPPFFVGVFLTGGILFFLSRHVRFLDGSRSFFVKRLGGVAVILAFLVSIFFHDRLVISPPILGVAIGSVILLIFGVCDDAFRFGWKTQLVFQCSLVFLLFFFGVRIFSVPIPFVGQVVLESIPFGALIGFFVLFVWVLLVMNALNWADGLDGILPSVSAISFFVIFLLSLIPEVNQPPIGIVALAVFGSMIALFAFNAPPARILSGTTGSFFAGFALASFSVLSGTKIATALLTLSLPTLDALWVISERLASGVSPFCGGDVRHLHYRLRDIGWSDWRIVRWYSGITAGIGGIALSTHAIGKTISFGFVSLAILAFLFWVRRKTLAKNRQESR